MATTAGWEDEYLCRSYARHCRTRTGFLYFRSDSHGVPHGLYRINSEEGSSDCHISSLTTHSQYRVSSFEFDYFEAEERYDCDAIDIKNHSGIRRIRISRTNLQYCYQDWEEAYWYLNQDNPYANHMSTSTSTAYANPALTLANMQQAVYTLQKNQIALYPTPRVEGGEIKSLRGEEPMKLKIGQIISSRFGSEYTIVELNPDGKQVKLFGYPNAWYTPSDWAGFRIVKDIPMSQNEDGIPKSLSVMERISATPDDKTLIKAGYLANGDLTQKAKDMISVLQYQAFKADLVKAAQEELDEVKSEK
jgi:hypothetical protein